MLKLWFQLTTASQSRGKYFASILTEVDGENPGFREGKISGIDLGVKHFAVVTNSEKVSKYNNPKYLAKHEKNLKFMINARKKEFPSQLQAVFVPGWLFQKFVWNYLGKKGIPHKRLLRQSG